MVPLLALPAFEQKKRARWFLFYLPFVALAIGYAALIYSTRPNSSRFTDGSFSLSAPFWITWSKSFVSLLWFWGWPALIALILWRVNIRLVVVSLSWIAISFVPYMFLTYMTRIPSRQVYLASAGLAIIVGAAFAAFADRVSIKRHRLVLASVALIFVLGNVGVLWTKKRQQFLARAEKTEILIAFAREHDGRIFVECFPRPPIIAESVLKVVFGRSADTIVWDPQEASITPGLPRICIPDN